MCAFFWVMTMMLSRDEPLVALRMCCDARVHRPYFFFGVFDSTHGGFTERLMQ